MGRNQIETGPLGTLIKAEFVGFLKSRVNTPKAREELAKKMGVSPATVKDLLHRTDGSTSYDMIFNAFEAHLGLDKENIRFFFDRVVALIKFYSDVENQHPIKSLLSEQSLDEKTRLYIMIFLEMLGASSK